MRFSGLLLSCLFFPTLIPADTAQLATIVLRHRLPEEMVTLVRPLLDEGEVVVAAPSSLIVKASLARLEEINTLVQELDKKQHRLLITVVRGRGLTREALLAQAGIGARTSDDSGIAASGHGYRTEAAEAGQQAQRIQTLDGQAATLHFGEQHPLPVGGLVYGQRGEPIVVDPGIAYRERSTGFSVLPRLSGERVVVEIASWSERTNRRGGDIADTGSAETRLEADLGEWMELGGQVESLSRRQTGTIAHNYSTRTEADRIFIKVEDLDMP